MGKDLTLYRAVHEKMLKELNTVPNENTANSLISTLCSIWYHCFKRLKYDEVKKDITEFAFNKLPVILNRFNYRNGQNMIQNIESKLQDICGDLTALEFLIARAENEPKWLRLQNHNFWQQHGYSVAQLRSRIGKKLPETLSERLLAMVLAELREKLRNMNNNSRDIYWKHYNSYYWKEKEKDFVKTASEVLKKYQNSGPRVKYIANYLFNGVDMYDLAIDALFAAYRKGILDIDGRYRLCDYLHQRKRWKESIPLLQELIDLQPEPVRYRTMLMRAAYHTGQKDLRNNTLADAEKYYREKNLWHESNIAGIASTCLDTGLLEESVKYYDEAIALHVKNHANRGIGNGTLSQYYRRLGEAYSKLKRTDEAVDAAAGAIISWGNNIDNRQYALQNLENILFNAEDLDAFVERFSADVKKTGLENPILRKALGKVYLKKKKYEQAAFQLQEAIAEQPNDVKTHRLLIQTYDNMKRPDKATAQLLKALLLSGHDISLYKELAARYLKLEEAEKAERAETGMVEMLPNESESHQALAELWQKQKRKKDAEIQWHQVIRIRSKEPVGYIGLAKNLIKQKKNDEARKILHKLISTSWPKHFGNIHRDAENMLKKLK